MLRADQQSLETFLAVQWSILRTVGFNTQTIRDHSPPGRRRRACNWTHGFARLRGVGPGAGIDGLRHRPGEKSCFSCDNAADRISNGPHIYCPDPRRPGRMGVAENCVWVTFNRDLYAKGGDNCSGNRRERQYGNWQHPPAQRLEIPPKLFHRMLAPWLKKGFDRKAEIGSLATGPERLRRVLTFLGSNCLVRIIPL